MTRKDYVLLADALRQARKGYPEGSEARRAVDLVTMFVAEALASDNPRFDIPTFYTAACKE